MADPIATDRLFLFGGSDGEKAKNEKETQAAAYSEAKGQAGERGSVQSLKERTQEEGC